MFEMESVLHDDPREKTPNDKSRVNTSGQKTSEKKVKLPAEDIEMLFSPA
jgi:hypothetical protein